MADSKNMLSFDFGNSTLRSILCHFDGEKITSEVILSEANEIIKIDEYFYWDFLRLFSFMKKSIEKAASEVKLDSVGICTWGVDFMLFDGDNHMLSNALCYRNSIGSEIMERQSAGEQKAMFYRTGILCDKINSIYMLKGIQEKMPSIASQAKKLLMVPDVLTYFMTGVMENEPSELSTTQLFDVRSMSISHEQCEALGIDPGLFQKIGEHGKVIGNIKREILDEMKIDYDIPFICAPSHDTASAVFGIPCEDEEFFFVSSGTWALIGAQIKKPVLTEEVIEGRLTNEVGAFGRITLLKNSIGMFITQRLKAEYQRDIQKTVSWNEFTDLAKGFEGKPGVFDVNHGDFFNPVHMGQAIHKHLHPEDADGKLNWNEIVASVFASIAESYCIGLRAVMKATGKEADVIYVVGGGSKNAIINQTCADDLGKKIVTCDMECSCVGVAAAQLAGICPEFSYGDLRKIIKASLKTNTYYPGKK